MIIANENTGGTGHASLKADAGAIRTLVPQGNGGSRFGSLALATIAKGGHLSSIAAPGMEIALIALVGSGAVRAGNATSVIKPLYCFFAGTETVAVEATEDLRLLVIISAPAQESTAASVPSRMMNIPEVDDNPFHMPEQGFYHLSARWLVDGSIGSHKLVVGQSTFVQNGSSHELHRHDHAEEFFFLLDGNGVHLTEDGEHPMDGGDVVLVPMQEWHGFRNTGAGPARAVFGYFGVNSLETSGYELHWRTIEMASGA
jgi:quercetin dioxygenase-like cupin family protein